MHEISIAQSILKSVKQSVKKLEITEIHKIHISIGVLSGVEKEALLYSFNFIPKDKLFKKTKLIINENILVVYCSACKTETPITDGFTLRCSRCGNLTSAIVKGNELTIDRIEY